jgi:hypothetical protein
VTEIEAAKRIIEKGRCSLGAPDKSDCPLHECGLCRFTPSLGGQPFSNDAGFGENKHKALEWFKRWLSEHGESTPQGKTVDHFEVRKWYKWVGPKTKQVYWNSPAMDAIWDGLPHLCRKSSGAHHSDFSGVPEIPGGSQGGCWDWGSMEYFREVPDPNTRDSTSGHPRTLGDTVTDKIAGKSEDFNPSSVKTRSQRRAEILHGLTID